MGSDKGICGDWGKIDLGFCFLGGVWWVRSLLLKGSFLHGMGKGVVWVF